MLCTFDIGLCFVHWSQQQKHVTDPASNAQRYPLVRLQTQHRRRLQTLVGKHPKPFNNFKEIGYAIVANGILPRTSSRNSECTKRSIEDFDKLSVFSQSRKGISPIVRLPFRYGTTLFLSFVLKPHLKKKYSLISQSVFPHRDPFSFYKLAIRSTQHSCQF